MQSTKVTSLLHFKIDLQLSPELHGFVMSRLMSRPKVHQKSRKYGVFSSFLAKSHVIEMTTMMEVHPPKQNGDFHAKAKLFLTEEALQSFHIDCHFWPSVTFFVKV